MIKNWIECEAGLLGELIRGINYKKPQSSDSQQKGYLPVLRANNIKSNTLNFDGLKYVEEDLVKSEQKILKGDIVFAMSSGSKHLVGKSGQAQSDYEGSFGAFCSVFRPNENIDPNFIQFYFHSGAFRRIISNASKGSNINNLKREHILNAIIPLPSKPEQRAIVTKIEELFSDLDKGIADLKKAQDQLKVYHQAVLKKAFEGELTNEWREENNYSLNGFLNELKESKNRAIKQKLISKGEYFPNYDTKSLTFNAPKNWLILPWKTLCSNNKYAMKRGPFGSALKKAFFVEKGIVVYEQGHAINDEPFRHRYFISSEKFEELKAFETKAGDMIISCSGVTLGRICLLPYNADTGVINQALLKIDMDESIMLKKYFVQLFRSGTFQRLIFQKSLGSAMPNMVGMSELKEIPIPIPSIEEQHQILREIESRLSVCDKVEENISESLKKAKALHQSILKKAFEGTLLSEEEIAACKAAPDYEPASVLLKKIKAEKKKK